MFDTIEVKDLLKIFNFLYEKIKKLNDIFSLKFPFFWATNIINSLFITFIIYFVIISIYFSIPIDMGISYIFVILIYISPLGFFIYLNNCFQQKEKEEVLVLKSSILKLLINNFLYMIISFILLYVSLNTLEYKITLDYNDIEIKYIDEYYNSKNELILKYKDILDTKELNTKELISEIEKNLFNKKYESKPFYNEYQEDLKNFLSYYTFLVRNNDSLVLKEKQKNIEKKVNNINTIKQIIDKVKNFYSDSNYIMIIFSIMYIFGFISNISNLNIVNFFITFISISSISLACANFEYKLLIIIIPIIFYILKKFKILDYWKEIAFYISIILIATLHIYYIVYIEERKYSIEISNIMFLSILVIWTIIWYKGYFSLKLLSPKIKKNR